ncbi:hypothetical protein ERJ75_000249500 [Trypanosoma vivax]|nr:hypothetical protein TRVL_08597 [Trypanosoma vivax]KAH8618832.1 hypothetical protein ERJ75_000249500 [Trypanosoma vivax]
MANETFEASEHYSFHPIPDWVRERLGLASKSASESVNNERSVSADMVHSSAGIPPEVCEGHPRVVRHTVRFRGSRWKTMLKKCPRALEHTFKRDVYTATGLDAKYISSVNMHFTYILAITFVVDHVAAGIEVKNFHEVLKSYNFPRTLALYARQ